MADLRYLPLLWLSLAFVAGIVLADGVALAWPAWLALALAALAGLFVLRRIDRDHRLPAALKRLARGVAPGPLPLLVLAAALFAGGLRASLSQPALSPGRIAWYNGAGEIGLQGLIATPPDRRDTFTYLRLRVEQLELADGSTRPAGGTLLLKLPAGGEPAGGWQYGDRVAARLAPVLPPENPAFSFRDYLARQNVYAYADGARIQRVAAGQGSPLMAWIYRFKTRALAITHRIFPAPEADLLAGILLGADEGIPASVQQAFQDTGTTHIIAISGFNIAILAGLFARLFGRLLGPRKGALAAALAISLYTLLVGAQASVVRAAIMGWMGLLAGQIGRRQAGLNSLAATAAGMCLVDPSMPWDVGFQLSFTATLGLVLYAEPLTAAFARLAGRLFPAGVAARLTAPVSDYVLLTLAAQVTTLPVILYHFGRLSLVSLIANPLVLPIQPAVMLVGGAALLAGLIDPALGQLTGLLALPFARFTIRVLAWLAALPRANLELGPVSLPLVALFYAALLLLTFTRDRRALLARILKPVPALTVLGAATLAVWGMAAYAPDGRLSLAVLETRAGSAALITTPGGESVLVGGGERASDLSAALGRWLPPQRRALAALWVASAEKQEILGLPHALESVDVQRALWSAPAGASQAGRDLAQALAARDVPGVTLSPGGGLDLGAGARLTLLAQSPGGSALLLEWGSFRALLLAGEVDESLLDPRILPRGPISALVLPEKALNIDTLPAALDWLQPQVVVVQGSPAALPDGTQALSTESGWVRLRTDGENLWVERER